MCGWGSSPLTRGKLRRGRHLDLDPGLIPAHAGKTSPPSRTAAGQAAHPRSRGENRARLLPWSEFLGSSPLTRGKPDLLIHFRVWVRLIPAHAGKTLRTRRACSATWAHPRSRGENEAHPRPMDRSCGSSPLTRGKPPFPPILRDGFRLIPAHAGKTWSRGSGR